jgi:protein arginine kinase activator
MSLPGFQKCEKCGRPATFKFTRMVDGQWKDLYFCDDHAAQSSPYIQKSSEIPSPEAIKAFLKGIAQNAGEVGVSSKIIPNIKCKSCGLPFEAYRRTLLLGCPECYLSFEKYLIADLRKFHGDVRHVGRAPENIDDAEAPPHAAELAFPPIGGESAKRVEAEDEAAALAEMGEIEEVPPVKAAANKPPKDSLAELRPLLKAAVKAEDFEQAARIRDQIRAIEKELMQQ